MWISSRVLLLQNGAGAGCGQRQRPGRSLASQPRKRGRLAPARRPWLVSLPASRTSRSPEQAPWAVGCDRASPAGLPALPPSPAPTPLHSRYDQVELRGAGEVAHHRVVHGAGLMRGDHIVVGATFWADGPNGLRHLAGVGQGSPRIAGGAPWVAGGADLAGLPSHWEGRSGTLRKGERMAGPRRRDEGARTLRSCGPNRRKGQPCRRYSWSIAVDQV